MWTNASSGLPAAIAGSGGWSYGLVGASVTSRAGYQSGTRLRTTTDAAEVMIQLGDGITPEPHEPLLVFVHIQKTAGLSLRHILFRQYGKRNTRLAHNYFEQPEECIRSIDAIGSSPPTGLKVLHGHMLFWPEISWPPGTRFITLLRDPVERTISHYYWLLSLGDDSGKTLEEAVAEGLILDNVQTRVLAACTAAHGQTPGEALDKALGKLACFTVVGLAERFEESLVLMTRRLRWRRMLHRRSNVTRNRSPKDELGRRTLELIEEHNALDLELVLAGRRTLSGRSAEAGRQFPHRSGGTSSALTPESPSIPTASPSIRFAGLSTAFRPLLCVAPPSGVLGREGADGIAHTGLGTRALGRHRRSSGARPTWSARRGDLTA